ncbi:MAG TPA: hypothetical protein VFF06_26050 [Polyangia bacterium]|nr:hypothetical protein [Polyangia bacterium]
MRRLILVTAAVALLGGSAGADLPRQLNVQGRLLDNSGTPKDGTFSISFTIYDAPTGGNSCHSETDTVPVNHGLFNTYLGYPSGISANCSFANAAYIEMKVGSDSPMSPRMVVPIAAYSITAQNLVVGSVAYSAGNGASQIPINNGAINSGLNASLVDGYSSAAVRSQPVYTCPGSDTYLKSAAVGTSCVLDNHATTTTSCSLNACGSTPANSCPAGCTSSWSCARSTGCGCTRYGCTTYSHKWTETCNCTGTLQGYLMQ